MLDVRIARFYNVYGPGESLDEKIGLSNWYLENKVLIMKRLPIVGDGEQRRDFTHDR